MSKNKESKWKQCIICQSDKGDLVSKPRTDSYKTLLDAVEERAGLHDGDYVEIHQRFTDYSKETLIKEKATWHRNCYLDGALLDHPTAKGINPSFFTATITNSAPFTHSVPVHTHPGQFFTSKPFVICLD
jgi:hypothetical protein